MNINKSNKFLFFLYNRSFSTPEHADKLLYRANVGYPLTLFKVTCKTCITIFNPSAEENDNFPFFSKKILFKNTLIWSEKKHRFFYYIIWSELFISAISVVKLLHSAVKMEAVMRCCPWNQKKAAAIDMRIEEAVVTLKKKCISVSKQYSSQK